MQGKLFKNLKIDSPLETVIHRYKTKQKVADYPRSQYGMFSANNNSNSPL
jgi:hypothetical protein